MRKLGHTTTMFAVTAALILMFLLTVPSAVGQTESAYDETSCWSWPSCWYYIRIQYSVPGTIPVGQPFQVPVQVSYRENQYFYTGYLDTYNVTVHVVPHPTNSWTPYGNDVATARDNSKVRTYFNGEGYSHTFILNAPQDLGQYDVYVTCNTDNQAQDFIGWGPTHVNASSSEWNTANWGVTLPELTTTILPGYLSVGVQGLSSGATVTVDGKSTRVAEDAYLEIRLNVGQHVVEVPAVIQLGEGAQAVFIDWSDGITANTRTIGFNGNGLRITAQYETQFYLQVGSNYGTAQGAGWYNANMTAAFSASTPSLFDPHVLDHWEGNYDGNDPTGTILMNGPKNVHAVYRTDYSRILPPAAIVATISVIYIWIFSIKWPKRPPTLSSPKPHQAQVIQQTTAPTRMRNAYANLLSVVVLCVALLSILVMSYPSIPYVATTVHTALSFATLTSFATVTYASDIISHMSSTTCTAHQDNQICRTVISTVTSINTQTSTKVVGVSVRTFAISTTDSQSLVRAAYAMLGISLHDWLLVIVATVLIAGIVSFLIRKASKPSTP